MDIKVIQVNSKLSNEERETILHYDYIDKIWTIDSTVVKHFNKALRQGWKPIVQYVYDDGTVCGMVLTAPDRAITIRNAEKKQLSEKQKSNLFDDDEDE